MSDDDDDDNPIKRLVTDYLLRSRLSIAEAAFSSGLSVNGLGKILDGKSTRLQDKTVKGISETFKLGDSEYIEFKSRVLELRNRKPRKAATQHDGLPKGIDGSNNESHESHSPQGGIALAPGSSARQIPGASKSSIVLHDLPDSTIFIAVSDVYNYNLYYRIAGFVPLVNHLETALMLGMRVIMHCSDPYRSAAVLALLNEFKAFVADGTIMFLYGSSIHSPKEDFVAYISRKALQYGASAYGSVDVKSLSTKPEGVEFQSVIDILELSPFILHRGFSGTRAFIEAVIGDLQPTEVIATNNPLAGKLRNVNLTLRQILSLQRIGTDGKGTDLVATAPQTDAIVDDVTRRIDHQSFSRQILLKLIHEVLGARHTTRDYLNMIETRINLLHLGTSVGEHTFTEMHPQREVSSPYFFRYLLDHLGALGDRAPKPRIGFDLIKRLKGHEQWPRFVDYHLRIMAELYARRLGDLPVDPSERFAHTRRIDRFRPLGIIIREQWAIGA